MDFFCHPILSDGPPVDAAAGVGYNGLDHPRRDAEANMDRLQEKYERLKADLRALGGAAVAFSGGVDSSFLLRAALDALGAERVLAVTAAGRVFPRREGEDAAALCRALGVRQAVVPFDNLAVEGFAANPANRCYLCKRALLGKLIEVARAAGFETVVEGSNADDEGDYRPGMRAVAELGALSPLRAAGLEKAEIRTLSRALGLPTWDKPSCACLASRIAYGEAITAEKLARVERAERRLAELGFRQLRVRVHGNLARVELPPEDMPRLLDPALRAEIGAFLLGLGFDYAALDLAGYRTGSMNLGLKDKAEL